MLDKHRNPDGTYDGIGALGELSGLDRKVMTELAAKAKANHARLSACPRHDFEPVSPASAPGCIERLRQRYVCRNCSGDVDHHAWYWHEQGRRAVAQ